MFRQMPQVSPVRIEWPLQLVRLNAIVLFHALQNSIMEHRSHRCAFLLDAGGRFLAVNPVKVHDRRGNESETAEVLFVAG
jgi:hypothetical protein